MDRVIQHQCGAFYRCLWSGSTYRWHFLPVSSHARPGFQALLAQTGTGRYPVVTYATVSDFANTNKAAAATRAILEQQKDDSNGGCVAITGGIIMNRYREFYRSLGANGNGNKNILNDYSKTRNGMRYSGTWDRCSESGGRPPYFPFTTRVFVVRSLEVGMSRANTPGRVATYLRSLLGKPL